MIQTFNLPIYKRVVYSFSPKTGYYTKTDQQPEKYPCNALPYELKREVTQAAQIACNAKECLTKHEYKKGNHSRKLLTGLQGTNYQNWFTGDHLRIIQGNKIRSLLLIHFSTDNSILTILFFSGFFKEFETQRQSFANIAIPEIMNKHFVK